MARVKIIIIGEIHSQDAAPKICKALLESANSKNMRAIFALEITEKFNEIDALIDVHSRIVNGSEEGTTLWKRSDAICDLLEYIEEKKGSIEYTTIDSEDYQGDQISHINQGRDKNLELEFDYDFLEKRHNLFREREKFMAGRILETINNHQEDVPLLCVVCCGADHLNYIASDIVSGQCGQFSGDIM